MLKETFWKCCFEAINRGVVEDISLRNGGYPAGVVRIIVYIEQVFGGLFDDGFRPSRFFKRIGALRIEAVAEVIGNRPAVSLGHKLYIARPICSNHRPAKMHGFRQQEAVSLGAVKTHHGIGHHDQLKRLGVVVSVCKYGNIMSLGDALAQRIDLCLGQVWVADFYDQIGIPIISESLNESVDNRIGIFS